VNVTEERKGNKLVLRVEGRLDASTFRSLEEKLMSAIDGGEKVIVLDFADLDYISSAGLRVLIVAAKKAKSTGGKILLACLKSHIKEVFDIANLSAIFPIFASQQEAIDTP